MAVARSHGSHPAPPPTASQPPTGATAIARPRYNCVQVVYRLASEYQNTIARATGDSAKHTAFSREAANTNTRDETTTKATASGRLIRPLGSSRADVRGFNASRRASAIRLNPIAALRAPTMATKIHATFVQVTGTCRAASTAPASANGSANTLWLIRTNEA